MFLDLQLPLGKNTLRPLTVTSDFGSEAITLQHWHVVEAEHTIFDLTTYNIWSF